MRRWALLRCLMPKVLVLTGAAMPLACAKAPDSGEPLSALPVAAAAAPIVPESSASGAASGPAGLAPGSPAPALPSRISGVEPVTIRQGEPLTFDRAFTLVEQRNTNLIQLRSTLERSRVNYQSVAAGYTSDWDTTAFGNAQPPIERSTFFNRIANNPIANNPIGANFVGNYFDEAGVELRWTLPWWHKEGVKYDAQSSQFDIAIAEENYQLNEKDQAVNLLKAYVQVRLYQEKVRVSAEQLKVDRARRDFMLQGAHIGTQTDLAVTTQEADTLNQEATTAHLQNQLTLNRQALFDLLNVPDADVKFCRNYFAYFTFDPSKWDTDWALQEQTRSLKLQVAKQEVQKQKAQITWQPSLALRSSFGRLWDVSRPGTQDIVGLGAILTVPFPNFEQLAAQQELARHDMNDLLVKLDEKVLNTQRTAARDRDRIPVLAANLRVRKRGMAEYAKQLADTRRSFELGLITYLQVQTVENSAIQTTQQFYDDLAGYIDLVVDYARLHGRPFPIPTTCATQ